MRKFPCGSCRKAADAIFGRCSCDARVAWIATLPLDAMVKAVRADSTCSLIDERYSDAELREALVGAGTANPAEAVKWAQGGEELFLE